MGLGTTLYLGILSKVGLMSSSLAPTYSLLGCVGEARRNSEDGEQQKVRPPGKAQAVRSWFGSEELAWRESGARAALHSSPARPAQGQCRLWGSSVRPFYMNALCFSFFFWFLFVCCCFVLLCFVLPVCVLKGGKVVIISSKSPIIYL